MLEVLVGTSITDARVLDPDEKLLVSEALMALASHGYETGDLELRDRCVAVEAIFRDPE